MNIINTRRQFIKSLGQGILGGAAVGSGLMPLLANAEIGASEKYKALVCINLEGGNDAFNMLVPTGASHYAAYKNARSNIAIQRDHLTPLAVLNNLPESYGLHPELLDVSKLFHQGKIALLGNIGNLIEPVTKATYMERRAKLPPHLFSHKEQADYLQTLNGGEMATGWAGRVAEAMSGFNINQQLAMNITLSGDNNMQRGNLILPYSVKNTGVNAIEAFSEENPADFSASRAKLYRNFLNRNRSHLLQKHYSDIQLNAWSMAQYVSDVLKSQPQLDFPLMKNFSVKGLGQSLAMATKLIAANEAFQIKRQVFYINLGSFDTHRNQLTNQSALFAELNRGLAEFYQALENLGLADQVTTFTTSEFGRTFTMNGNDGTDHGWTSHHLVMGGAVKGQQIYGAMPQLEIGSDDDVGEGRFIPSLSFDQYAATLSEWFGVGRDDIAELFPYLKNFSQKNLGFLS
ncbi:MAG TPA: DUF1501 domain-containing protein [Cellvibrio sp.]|nr:DUF1501 domain-containing protein [Cellvibrio sp.]